MDETTTPNPDSSGDDATTADAAATASPLEQGKTLMQAGRFAEAADALRQAVTASPHDEAAWRLLGGALASSGDAGGAVEAFRRAVELNPTSAKNVYNLGLAYQSTGDVEQATANMRQALALDPQYAQAQQRLSELTASASPAPPPMSESPLLASDRTMVMDAMAQPPGTGATAPPPSPPPPASPGLNPVGGGGGLNAVGGSGLNAVGGGAAPELRPPGAPPPTEPTAGMGAYGQVPGGYAPGGYAPTPQMGMSYAQGVNTSGMKGEVPAELQGGWNWGAFYITPFWLMFHGFGWQGAVYLVGWLLSLFLPIIGLVLLGVSIYLGVIGNRLGWQNRRFQSIEDFRACQRIWAWWSLGLFLAFVVLFILFFSAIVAALGIAAMAGGGRGGSTP